MPIAFECRSQQNQAELKPLEGKITGYPIVFNKQTKIRNDFYEKIDRNAFQNTDMSDVKFFINHNEDSIPVARYYKDKESTMSLEIDEDGIKLDANLDVENNFQSRMLCSAVQRGDIKGMSFCFSIEVADNGEEWLDTSETGLDLPLRIIRNVKKLYEVSAVNDPAYEQTTISARSIQKASNIKTSNDSNFMKEKFKFKEENR